MRRGAPISQAERRPAVHVDLESPVTEENSIDDGITILAPKNNISNTMSDFNNRIPSMESMTIGSGVLTSSSSPNNLSSSSYSKLDKADNYSFGPPGSFTFKRSNKFEITSLLTHLPQTLIQKLSIYFVIAAAFLSLFFPLTGRILILVYTCAALGLLGSLWLSRTVLSCDDGTPEMRAVSDPIREGAEGFLRVQYTVWLESLKKLLLILCFQRI